MPCSRLGGYSSVFDCMLYLIIHVLCCGSSGVNLQSE